MPEPSSAEQFSALLAAAPPERHQEVVDALYSLACGFRFWAGDERKPPTKARARYRVVRSDAETGEQEEGWIYEIPPDPRAQQVLAEQLAGRPAMKSPEHRDMAVFIAHRIPGRRSYVAEDMPEPEEALPEGALEVGGQLLGIGAALRADDPEDGDE